MHKDGQEWVSGDSDEGLGLPGCLHALLVKVSGHRLLLGAVGSKVFLLLHWWWRGWVA